MTLYSIISFTNNSKILWLIKRNILPMYNKIIDSYLNRYSFYDENNIFYDELFTQKEIKIIKNIINKLNIKYKIIKHNMPVKKEKLPAWNIIGKILDLKLYKLPYDIIGCLV